MITVGQRQIRTQQQVVAFSKDALCYRYLGHGQDRLGNRNVEETFLTDRVRLVKPEASRKKTT